MFILKTGRKYLFLGLTTPTPPEEGNLIPFLRRGHFVWQKYAAFGVNTQPILPPVVQFPLFAPHSPFFPPFPQVREWGTNLPAQVRSGR